MHYDKKAIETIIRLMLENRIPLTALVGPYEKAVFRLKNKESGKLCNTREICNFLKISRATLYRYVKAGMPYCDKGSGRGKIYSVSECRAFVKQYKRIKAKGNGVKL